MLGFTFAAYGTSSVAHTAEPAQPVAAKQAPAQTEDSTPAAKTQEAAAPAAKANTPAAQATKAAPAEKQETKAPVKADNATAQADAKTEQKAAQPAAKAVPAKGDAAKATTAAKKAAAVDANKAVKTDAANKPKKDEASDKTKKTDATSRKANALKAENTILARKLRRRSVEDPVDENDWDVTNRSQGDGITLTNFHGTVQDNVLVVPNTYDFEQAGKINPGQKVYLDPQFLRNHNNRDFSDRNGNIAKKFVIYHNGGGQVFADGNWNDTFEGTHYTSIDLTNLDVSGVTGMQYMFAYSQANEILGLENWDTGNVTTIGGMFANCSNLTQLDLSNWNTAKVTNLSQMFWADGDLTSVGDLHTRGNIWNTSKVNDSNFMFGGTGVTHLNISGWDLRNDGNVGAMLCLNFGKPNSAAAFIDMRGVKLPTRTNFTTGDFNLKQYLVVYSDNDNLRDMLNSDGGNYDSPQTNMIEVDTIGGTSGGVAVEPQFIGTDIAFKDENDFVSYLQQQTSDPYLRDLLNLDDGQYVSNYDPNNSNHGLIHDYSKVFAGNPLALITMGSQTVSFGPSLNSTQA